MPLRSPKMNRFIFGFQRRVWCPKWTPASSICRMVTTAMVMSPLLRLAAHAPGRRGDRRRSRCDRDGARRDWRTVGRCYRRTGGRRHRPWRGTPHTQARRSGAARAPCRRPGRAAAGHRSRPSSGVGSTGASSARRGARSRTASVVGPTTVRRPPPHRPGARRRRGQHAVRGPQAVGVVDHHVATCRRPSRRS